MNLNEYQKLAARTIAPSGSPALDLAVAGLGLVGEALELLGADSRAEIRKELGDVLWYVARIATWMDAELTGSFADLEEAAEVGGASIAIRLARATGGISEDIKKYVGHGHDFSKRRFTKSLREVLELCAGVAVSFDISLKDAAVQNIEKLKKRYPEGFSTEASIARKDVPCSSR